MDAVAVRELASVKSAKPVITRTMPTICSGRTSSPRIKNANTTANAGCAVCMMPIVATGRCCWANTMQPWLSIPVRNTRITTTSQPRAVRPNTSDPALIAPLADAVFVQGDVMTLALGSARGVNAVRYFVDGPLTVMWGEVLEHRLILLGKATQSELSGMLQSALPTPQIGE